MSNNLSKIIKIDSPVLRDEQGVVLATFESASIASFKSGKKDLDTQPQFLPDNFPVSVYSFPGAPALYLESGEHKYPVVVVGGLLALADSITIEG